MRSPNQIERQIEEKQAEIARLEAELERAKELPEDKMLAEQLHGTFCTWNHIDGCAWEYESWDKPGNDRMRWLNKAQAAIAEGLTFDHIQKVKRVLAL